MRTLLITLLRKKSICAALVVVLGCDSFKEDFIRPEDEVTFSQTEFYAVPGSSVVIDLNSVIKQSFTNAVIEFSRPEHGLLSQLDPVLLEYTPNIQFLEGNDHFVLSVYKDGTLLKTQTVTIIMKSNKEEFPCDLFAIGDKVVATVASAVSIKILANDYLCGMNGSEVSISIHSVPAFGSATVVGDSIIRYIPQSMYEGTDQLIYKLNSSSGENISYGVVRVTVEAAARTQDDPGIRLLTIPRGHDLQSIFFVNENTGFIGGDGIYKTIDGGVTWNSLIYPQPSVEPLLITELFFLNAEEGFASFSICPNRLENCKGGLLHTTDGGDHWEVMLFDHEVISVFFSSSSIGYITLASLENGYMDYLWKTEDAGKSWREVFTTTVGLGTLKLRFASSKSGFAYSVIRLFRTSNGFESWESSGGGDYIASFAVSPENIASANTSYGWDLNSPSSIMRSGDGLKWNEVASFPYLILQQAFSPTGNRAIAIGISNTNISVDPPSQTVTISTSADKGASWKDEGDIDDLYGYPRAISFPSERVAYVLCSEQIIKFTRL
jgi:hypothetical protein